MVGRKLRSRREFVTTKTDEKAIASPATIGFNTAVTARGIADAFGINKAMKTFRGRR